MGCIIIVMPKMDDAKKIGGLLNKHGYPPDLLCTNAAEALSESCRRDNGVIICGSRLVDMSFIEFQDCIPRFFKLIILSHNTMSDEYPDDSIKLAMPFKIIDLINTIETEFSKYYRRPSDNKLIKKERPDLIHVSMSESIITFGFLRCLGIFKEIPFVYTDRGLAYGYRWHSKFCIKAAMKHAEYMICTTEYNKELWTKNKVKCEIKTIPNTISKAFDAYNDNKRSEMRIKHKIKENEFVVGFAGRISEEKDWDFVPVLVKALKEAELKFKVALVISVYEEQDNKIVDSIKRGIIDSIGEDNLIYMQDLTQSEIADYYYMVDVFVMSSMFESFGKAAVEAMSRKCSVLSTSVGGLPEVIGKKENLYTKETVGDFVKRMKVLMEDREELNKDREFFYNRYRNCYTTEVHVLRHASLYRDILERHNHK